MALRHDFVHHLTTEENNIVFKSAFWQLQLLIILYEKIYINPKSLFLNFKY